MAINSKTVDFSGLTLKVGAIEASTSATAIAGGSTKTLTTADAGKQINLDTLTGTVITLPTATGSGIEFEFVTTVVPTSNSHIVKVPNATTYMSGALMVVDNATGASTVFGTTGSTTTRSDTITLNRTTTGAVAVGERFVAKDTGTGFWAIKGVVIGTGVIATPFSAAV